LHIRHVVATLRFVGGRVPGVCSRYATAQQADARANRGTLTVATDRRARKSAYRCADDSTGRRAVLLRLCSGLATDLIVCVLPASAIVRSELIEVPARAG